LKKFKNVEHTNTFELVFLFASTIAVFAGMIFALNTMKVFGPLKAIIAIIIAALYFIIFKKNFIVKVSSFELTSNKLNWNHKSVDFNNIIYYRIHWMKGAGIKFKLKNGKTVRISSNDNFCNSKKFVHLSREIDAKLLRFNNKQILKKKSFFETKKVYYFAIVMSVLFVTGTIYKLFTGDTFNTGNAASILICLGIIWSGVRWKRK
jgi:hypothetical protein